ncbi:MAG: sensor histidine kinase [Maricaulaceae bacterium]
MSGAADPAAARRISSRPQVRTQGSLARRLVLGAAVWAVGLLALGVFGLSTLYRQAVFQEIDDSLRGVSETLIAFVENDGRGGVILPRQPGDPRFERPFSGRYWQVFQQEPGGGFRTILKSRSLFDETLEPAPAVLDDALAVPGGWVTTAVDGPDGQSLRLLLEASQLPGRPVWIIAGAAADLGPAERSVARFATVTGWAVALAAACLVIAIALQVRIGLGPVFRMSNDVAQVREGRAERLAGGYPSELAPLAAELNSLLDHSREVVERARTHVGNLAHALKTPISVLSTEVERQDSALADVVRRQTETMTRQVDHHLRRARAAARAQALGARTPVAPVVADLTRTLSRIFSRKGVKIHCVVGDDLSFRGERQDLEEMIGNLLENACKWGEASVGLKALATPDALVLHIDDDGPGVALDKRDAVLARGARLDETAPGSGLGLAIVHDLARAYGGRLSFDDAPAGGLRATLELPIVRS